MAQMKERSSSSRLRLSAVPLELMIGILRHSTYRSIYNFMMVNKACTSIVVRSAELWRHKCPRSTSGDVAELIETARINSQVVHSWMTGDGADVTLWPIDQADITHMQVIDKKVMVSSDDRSVDLYSTLDMSKVSFSGHAGGVWTFMSNGDQLATGSTDKTVRVWDVRTGVCLRILSGHRSTVRTVKMADDLIISGGRDGHICVWDRNGNCVFALRAHNDSVRAIDLDGPFMLSGSYDGTVKFWNFRKGRLLKSLLRHSLRVYSVMITKNYLVSGGQDAEVHLSSRNGKRVFKLQLHRAIVAYLDFAWDVHGLEEELLVTSGADGMVIVWNIRTVKCLYRIIEPTLIMSLKVHRSFLIVATSSYVTLYHLPTGRAIRRIIDNVSHVYKVDVHNDVLAIGYKNGERCYLSVFDFNKAVH